MKKAREKDLKQQRGVHGAPYPDSQIVFVFANIANWLIIY